MFSELKDEQKKTLKYKQYLLSKLQDAGIFLNTQNN